MSLEQFYVTNPEGERVYLTFDISHSAFTQAYKFVDDTEDLTTAAGVYLSEGILYAESESPASLDKTAVLTLNDFGDLVDTELDMVPLESTEPVAVVVKKWHSSDLTTPQESTDYSVSSTSQQEGLAVISMTRPLLNVNKTGERFSYFRFPMLRGL